MLRFSLLCRVLALACLLVSLSHAADPAAAPSLIGLSRDEVITLRGKPTGERQRGELLLMVYADGTRLELREGVVVSQSGGSTGGEIVGADGTRYIPGVDGNLRRPVEVAEPGSPAAPTAAPEAAASEAAGDESIEDLPPGADGAPATDAIERALEGDGFDDDYEEEPEAPLAVRVLGQALGIVFRLGFTLLVLHIALKVVGLPYFMRDLIKVALLYLAVREVMHSLGALGGWWEFIPLFRLDDLVSFIVLACSLTWFKIVSSGLTALKIAAVSKIVIVVLMYAVALAITFGLLALN